MRKYLCTVLVLVPTTLLIAQKGTLLKGMYIQWGYNTEWYTKSNIHFKLSNGDHFKLLKAKAHDKPDLEAIFERPGDISIPQYNYRLGFYLNKTQTTALEINFDHIKYVVTDNQKVKVKGVINGVNVDADSILDPNRFLHLEHTDGGNLLHINYVKQKTIKQNAAKTRALINMIWKVGAGINIPRTDFAYRGDRLNNKFHISGYNMGAEGGARYYFSKKWFFEGTVKSGYVRYINALINTTKDNGNRVAHGFGYFQCIALIGYDINF